MKNYITLLTSLLFLFAMIAAVNAQSPGETGKANIIISTDLGTETISRHIYGHFSEHLGRCIYGGYWVGEGAAIPNTRGIRNDVVEALKKTHIPNLRWPGGCFADEYHWMDGKELPAVSASASRDKDGKVNMSIVNIDPSRAVEILIDLRGGEYKDVSGRILNTPALTAHNTFEKPEEVKPKAFKDAKIKKNMVSVMVPAGSIIVLTVE